MAQQTLDGPTGNAPASSGPAGAMRSGPGGAEGFGGYERQVARKVALRWPNQGEWVKVPAPADGSRSMQPSYVVTAHGEKVARCRVLATVVDTFVSEDGQFASVTLDDGTDTIRAKAFKEIQLLKAVAVGDRVEITGKMREYNGEVYILPEAIAKVTDPNAELLRRLELLQKGPVGTEPSGGVGSAKPGADDAARDKILAALEKAKELTYAQVVAAVGDEAAAERAITALLEEGVCYEPTPGKVRKI